MTRRSVMLLFAALAIAAVSPVESQSQSHVMPVQRFVNGNPVPQGAMMMSDQATAAAISALTGELTQPAADDRSLKLIAKAVPIVGLAKWKKKKKKSPVKSPFKNKFHLPLFLGGAAAAATAASGAASAATKGAAAAAPGLGFFGPGIITSTLPDNVEVPMWKVHKYNGIDIRPVRLSELVASPALPPPSETEEFQQVVGKAPVEVPEPVAPVFGTPADTLPISPDNVVFPKNTVPATPSLFYPAPTYGVPAPTYGVPAPTYGVPAPTYGVPAPTYSFPPPNYGPTYGVPVPTYGVPTLGYQQAPSQPVSFPSDAPVESAAPPPEITEVADDESTAAGLEALSNLGALTDFLPGGEGGSRFPSFFSLGRGRESVPFSFFNRFVRGQQPAEQEQSQSTVYTQQPSAIQNLLGRIPIISSLTNFGNGNPASHVSIPPLPELPTLPDITNVQGLNSGLSQVPHVRLPTRYVLKGTPYTSIRYPQYASRPVIIGQSQSVVGLPATPSSEGLQAQEQPEAVAAPPEPAAEPVEPVQPEQSYPLPLEQPQAPQQPQQQYGFINSYGQPVQTGYYVTPVISAPAPPQYAVPFYSTPVAGLPASKYGPPEDAAGSASEIDAVAVSVPAECTEGNNCGEARSVKVPVPEGQTRSVKRDHSAPTVSPVFKKEEAKETSKTKETKVVDDMARYLDPTHPAAMSQTTQVTHFVEADASPSTNTEEETES